MAELVEKFAGNTAIQIVAVAVVMDTIFGVARAVKHRKFNSSFGIDGAIRKSGMIISLVFFVLVDEIVHINLTAFIPQEITNYLTFIKDVGLTEFFSLLYIAYETVSILKNMTLCGLPVESVWKAVQKFLNTYTEELPDVKEE